MTINTEIDSDLPYDKTCPYECHRVEYKIKESAAQLDNKNVKSVLGALNVSISE